MLGVGEIAKAVKICVVTSAIGAAFGSICYFGYDYVRTKQEIIANNITIESLEQENNSIKQQIKDNAEITEKLRKEILLKDGKLLKLKNDIIKMENIVLCINEKFIDFKEKTNEIFANFMNDKQYEKKVFIKD